MENLEIGYARHLKTEIGKLKTKVGELVLWQPYHHSFPKCENALVIQCLPIQTEATS